MNRALAPGKAVTIRLCIMVVRIITPIIDVQNAVSSGVKAKIVSFKKKDKVIAVVPVANESPCISIIRQTLTSEPAIKNIHGVPASADDVARSLTLMLMSCLTICPNTRSSHKENQHE